jgi:hypothetical protein
MTGCHSLGRSMRRTCFTLTLVRTDTAATVFDSIGICARSLSFHIHSVVGVINIQKRVCYKLVAVGSWVGCNKRL